MTGLKKWIPAIIMCVFIFWLSSVSGQDIKKAGLGNEGIHIDGHLGMYFLLGISLYYATGNVFYAFVFALFYGITDEIHQLFTPLRSASLFDVFVDGLGAIIGICVWKYYPSLFTKLKSLHRK